MLCKNQGTFFCLKGVIFCLCFTSHDKRSFTLQKAFLNSPKAHFVSLSFVQLSIADEHKTMEISLYVFT